MNSGSERPVLAWPLAGMLLLSGACAIVYQLVWVRELRLVFGATTASSAAVLAIFMAGLGLGNSLLGKRADAALRPLRLYGLLEAGAALAAAFSPWLIDLARQAYTLAGGQAALGGPLATVLRLATSTAILGLPTFLMGGTLPAAARAVTLDSDLARRRVAMLYGLNTLGAVVGAGLATFALLELLGNRAVLWMACAVNLAVAATACAWSRRLLGPAGQGKPARKRSATPKPARDTATEEGAPRDAAPLPVVCLAAGAVGFVFFLMEIVWYRMLGPLLGGTTYTFGLILCAALLGIGLGGALYAWLAAWVRPGLPSLAATCAVEALLIALPFAWADDIAVWVLRQHIGFAGTFSIQVWNWFQVAAAVVLPAALVAGFQFPLLIAMAGSGRGDVGKHVGWTFAANTAGAIAGSLAGGFFLLPLLTAPGLWRLAVAALVVLAAALAAAERQWKRPSLAAAAIAGGIALWAAAQAGPSPVWRHSGIGAGRAVVEGRGRNAERQFMNRVRRECLGQWEGIESSVAIAAADGLSLLVNGKSDGNAYSDAGTQIGLGLLGPLLHPVPRRAAVIGLGTGESAGWLADCQTVAEVDVVELEPATIHMARLCSTMNRDVLDNPKARLHFNDGREFLITARTPYDLIVSEPSNPYRAGVATLYTREFYAAAAARLNADGLFLQWLQGYEVDDATVAMVLRTLRAEFAHVEVWQAKAGDLILVCSPSPLRHDAAAIDARLRGPVLREGLNLGWRVNDLAGVMAHYVCGKATIDRLLAGDRGPVNTDDRNLLEYAFARSVGRDTRFALAGLRSRAAAEGDRCPIGLPAASAAALPRRRLAMLAYFGEPIPPDHDRTPVEHSLAECLSFYQGRRYAEASAKLESAGVDPACPIESVLCAHARAEAGLPIGEDLLASVRRFNATEAAAIEAIALANSGRADEAVPRLEEALVRMRTDPWTMPQVIGRFLVRLSDLESNAAVEAALRMLAEPFAVRRLEQQRLLLRFVLAQKLGRQATVEALGAMEPHVPWREWFLRDRAQAYEASRHPLAAPARRELEQFQRWEE